MVLEDGPLELRQFQGGASNLTYELRVGARKMILRRPPAGTKPKSGHDMHREYRVMKALAPHFPCPRVLAYSEDPALLGAPWPVLRAHVDDVLARGRAARAHILNLGHGVPPDTDPDVLTRIVAHAHGHDPSPQVGAFAAGDDTVGGARGHE